MRDPAAPVPLRRWLALVFPWLPSERLRATRAHLFVGGDDAPMALVETIAGTVRVAAIDRAGAAAGLTLGCTLAAARKAVPRLATFPHDPAADLDWLQGLADGCARYTPAVSFHAPDALVLGLGDGGSVAAERALAADVERRLARRGVTVAQAFGDTPAIAHALARHAGAPAPDERGAVRRLPVAALDLAATDTAALCAAGWKTVGEVMVRPAGEIAERFGRAVADAVQALASEGPFPAPVPVAARVTAERHLAQPLAGRAPVMAIVADLLGEATAVLDGRQEGGRRWRLRLFGIDGAVRTLDVETAEPVCDAGPPMRLFARRMTEAAGLPDAACDLIRLEVVLTGRRDRCRLRLEGGAAAPQPTPAGARRAPRAADGGQPAQGELLLPAAAAPPRAPEAIRPDAPPPDPIHLFDPPEPIDAIGPAGADSLPIRFRWRRRVHEVARADGPERVAARASRTGDGNGLRAYFRVVDRRGRRLWIFRQDARGTAAPRWYVHGLFA